MYDTGLYGAGVMERLPMADADRLAAGGGDWKDWLLRREPSPGVRYMLKDDLLRTILSRWPSRVEGVFCREGRLGDAKSVIAEDRSKVVVCGVSETSSKRACSGGRAPSV